MENDMICPICKSEIYGYEKQGLYDGVCAYFCLNCDYIDILDRFKNNKDIIIEDIKKIKKDIHFKLSGYIEDGEEKDENKK